MIAAILFSSNENDQNWHFQKCNIYFLIPLLLSPTVIIPPANIVWVVHRNRSVRTNFHIFCPISTKLEFKIMMCELCSTKDFIVCWVLPLLCLFAPRNFETIQYALCHCKFPHMINQKFMKLRTLQDPNMKMCTLVVYPGPSSFLRIMSLKVVFQICFGY